ncbi:DNA cytosine methyltransferase [Hyphomonas sp.]|uniref:DNA cytosine methyltransferase n=1 Tax=Hyphomonas sp. TaxID=87 RepID=UPI000DFACD99|nr:DNA cytosine methyltransferase [Hyphomonas sp.]RCL90139.1 MAG: DNA cytosine methyltransferase [Hyphomonas sp.]
MEDYGIIDLFAGPGGLGEGFSMFRNEAREPVFKIFRSIEKEPSAHSTLRLRAFLRNAGTLPAEYLDFHAGLLERQPDWSSVDKAAWSEANAEALCLELGRQETTDAIEDAIVEARRIWGDRTVVIGGPPCQAYSLAGRSRNKGIVDYDAASDHRHFLFREYLNVLASLKPAVFIMENVKGLLSSSVNDQRVFDLIMSDLRNVGEDQDLYTLVPLTSSGERADLLGDVRPSDFIIRAEEHGVPQARHRVILMGVRKDVFQSLDQRQLGELQLRPREERASVQSVISSLPKLRSGLSKEADTLETWRAAALSEMRKVKKAVKRSKSVHESVANLIADFESGSEDLSRASSSLVASGGECSPELQTWLGNSALRGTANHEARGHMRSDLGRYFFAAAFAATQKRSPKASEFPSELAPEHRNWTTGVFADRFRVQVAERPSTTITSHISKDGHYFIHPDPLQCRSLTVREAARLQTFPDDYLFLGNRTQQYVQVGNAVPPFLAHQIAGIVHQVLEVSARNSKRNAA